LIVLDDQAALEPHQAVAGMPTQPGRGCRAGVQRGELSDDVCREARPSGACEVVPRRCGSALLDATARPREGQGQPGAEQAEVTVTGTRPDQIVPA
jgi:hypothetical protein